MSNIQAVPLGSDLGSLHSTKERKLPQRPRIPPPPAIPAATQLLRPPSPPPATAAASVAVAKKSLKQMTLAGTNPVHYPAISSNQTRHEEATPKALMRMMGIPGLTLYHLKSHLQKYRLGKSNHPETYHEINQQDYKGNQRRDADFLNGEVGDQTQNPINESLKIAQALQLQMEVQRKLHEQIEVQRHLQLRIEAQGKYLQSVLKKAQETLSVYNSSSSVGVEIAKAELSQLVSMVDNGGPSSSVSVLTEEKSGNSNSVVLSLMDLHPNPEEKGAPSNQGSGRKRSGSIISDGNCGEQQKIGKKSGDESRWFDLNRQYSE